jgi:hypothetical protein
MNTPEKKAKYVKRPRYSGIKTRMNESLDSRIVRLQKILASGQLKTNGGKIRKLEDVDRVKINFRIDQAEREIMKINRAVEA